MKETIFLFDLDGVLVQPLGYRAAVRATVNDFSKKLGLPGMAPDDHTVAIFEAQGITCEWDMIPILLAILLETASEQIGETPGMDSFEQASQIISSHHLDGLHVDYAPVLRTLGQYTHSGEAPADSLLALCQGEMGKVLFPRLAGQGVLRELLSFTRRLDRSKTTHIFQTYVLGDRVFSEMMRMPPGVKSESFLEKYDTPLITTESRDRLLHDAKSGLRMAAYTARPSIPLSDPGERLALFTPEAEMALALVGMQSIPVIGSGQMGEAALRLHEPEDRLSKPSPYHALAAAAAAWSGDRAKAVDWVEKIYRALERGKETPVPGELFPESAVLHIFEDSPSGIRGVKDAAGILAQLGSRVELKMWGISDHPEKRAALEGAGAVLCHDINQAVASALNLSPRA